MLVGWDTLDVPTYRHEALPDYQSGRVFDKALLEQLDALPELVASFGFACGKAPGYEADDFLAAAAAQWKGPVVVATSDRDAFQLVSDRVTILQPVKGVSELARIGPAEVRERYGVEPGQVVDFIALRGDPLRPHPRRAGRRPEDRRVAARAVRHPRGGARRPGASRPSPTTCASTAASRRWTPRRRCPSSRQAPRPGRAPPGTRPR